ncbi:hypothetical protein Tco_0821760 [Tanacetum coccineum]|uniref:Uncharacterized protein n=1 Tax=Tanacetum coccineum TaxID=301880 RepID=A0ABQ5AD50_9ASTR
MTAMKDLKAAFRGKTYASKQKTHSGSVEIHHIKQMDGESTEVYGRYKEKLSGKWKESRECMKISGFMHRITQP